MITDIKALFFHLIAALFVRRNSFSGGDRVCRVTVDRVSANRAGGVGLEPRIDAVHVEAMAAFREEPCFLADKKLRQADGALQPTRELLGPEDDNWNGGEDGGV